MVLPVAVFGHGSDGLEVTSDFVRAPSDVIPRFCNLADAGAPVHQSIGSGNWSSPVVWSNGAVPGVDARVQIRAGDIVVYDIDSDVRIDCIEVQDHGRLRFATDRNTKIVLDVLMVMPEGSLAIGTALDPVSAAVSAQVVFRGDTELDTGVPGAAGIDPRQYGKGLIVFGTVEVHGRSVEPTFVRFAEEPFATDSVLNVETPLVGWRPGDLLIVPDTRQIPFVSQKAFTSQAEEVVVKSISGATIALESPLAHDHAGPRDVEGNVGPTERSMLPHVGNLTRNVVFLSEDGAVNGHRGHVLLLHRADIDIRYAAFVDLGRTTIASLDSSIFDSDGILTKVGENQIGRYSLHLHHVMGPENLTNTGYQLEVVGNVFHGMNKWGIAVHDTHYGLFRDNVAYAGIGSAIATEDGNESYNVFEHNFVVHTRAGDTQNTLLSVGRGGVFNTRKLFGTTRDAFWFSGEHNYVRDNVAANVPDFSYNYNGYYIKATMRVPKFRGADLQDPDEYEGWNYHGSTSGMVAGRDRREGLPVLESARNEAYGATGQGLWLTWARGCCSVSYYKQESLFEGYRFWHINHTGVYAFHESRNTFDDFVMRDDPAVSILNGPNARFNRGFWLGTSSYENGQLIVRNFDIQGFNIGIAMPPNPQDGTGEPNVSVLHDGVLKNHINLQESFVAGVSDKRAEIRNVSFTPVVTYASNSLPAQPVNIRMSPGTDKQMRPMRPSQMFVYDFNGVPGRSFQLYWVEQNPDAVVLPPNRPDLHLDDPDVTCPVQGLTNAECFAQFGVAVAGEIAPCAEIDGDDCSAARARAESLGITGLLFDIEADPASTPTATPEGTHTSTATVEPTVALPTSTSTVPPLPTNTDTPQPTAVPTATATLVPSPTATRVPSATETAVPTDTASPPPSSTPEVAFGCSPNPQLGCTPPNASRSTVVVYRGIRDRFDRVRFYWLADGQSPEDFPNPLTSGQGYAFCVYDYVAGTPTPVLAAVAPHGGECDDRPCWRSSGSRGVSYRYANPESDEGLRRVTISVSDDDRARLSVLMTGPSLDLPVLPFREQGQVTAQVQSSNGKCWGSDFLAPAGRNDRRRYRAQR